jgi:uncharacterized membrane protein YagU involved in acid resistance
MNYAAVIIAGLAGTVAMTILMYLAPLMGMPKLDIISMLGTMFTSNKTVATIIGVMAHLMMGVVFAFIYVLLWSFGIGSPTWLWGLIFGAVHGLMVYLIMPMINRMHPRPVEMEGGTKLAVGMLMVHMLYGLVVALVYASYV